MRSLSGVVSKHRPFVQPAGMERACRSASSQKFTIMAERRAMFDAVMAGMPASQEALKNYMTTRMGKSREDSGGGIRLFWAAGVSPRSVPIRPRPPAGFFFK